MLLVVDENDETPLFSPASVTVPLVEDESLGTLVHTFVATDRDAKSTSRNSELEWVPNHVYRPVISH